VSFKLLSSLLRATWLIHPDEAQKQLPLVAAIIKGETQASEQDAHKPILLVADASGAVTPKYYSGFDHPEVPENSTAIIPISGPIMKYDGPCGEAGSERLTMYVEQANNNPKIKNILLQIDSPGGMVDGTQTLAQSIANSKKPTLAFVSEGMACSAAYWVASAADEIWVSQKTDVVGSIGVFVTLADYSAYYESMGIKVTEIYADQSTEKNKVYKEALAGNTEPIRKQMLNPIAKEFITTVKANRKGKLNLEAGDPFKGATYMADEALQIGLIDAQGSLQEAIAHLHSISNSINPNKTQTESNMKFQKSLAAVLAVLGFASVQSDDEAPAVTAERLEQINASLQAANQTNADLQAQINTLLQEATASDAKIATLTRERDEAQAKADEYGKRAGATHTTTLKEAGDNAGDTTQQTEEQSFAEYAHNQNAINFLKNI
jgi:protease-4